LLFFWATVQVRRGLETGRYSQAWAVSGNKQVAQSSGERTFLALFWLDLGVIERPEGRAYASETNVVGAPLTVMLNLSGSKVYFEPEG